jgi:dTDP-4-dehydrorhamnose reductase
MKILVLGSNGQLGKCIQDLDFGINHSVIFASKLDVDVEDISQLTDSLTTIRPNILINTSGYTAVDKAEIEIEKADRINHLAVKNMADICKQIDCILIHISTDYVFDGNSEIPYSEEDPTNPQCIYGVSKLKGEEAIIDSGCNFYIVRTSWVFSEYGDNFLKTMLKIGQKLYNVSVVFDQLGCPTYAQDIALCILALVNHSTSRGVSFGIYHFSGSKICSWYDFANIIFKKAKNIGITTPQKITPVPSSEYVTAATRPHFSVLDSSKFGTAFGYSSSELEDSIDRVLDRLYS